MIKSLLKYFIAAYALLLVFLIILFFVKKEGNDSFWPFFAGIVACLAVVLLIGLFFGMLLSVLFKIPAREKLFYWIGQFISLDLFAVLVCCLTWGDGKKSNNDEVNTKTIEDVSGGTDGYAIKLAFNELRTKFTDPGEFYIDSTITTGGHWAADSTAGGAVAPLKDSVFNVYLVYHFPHLREGEFYTKATVSGTVVNLEKISEHTETSDDYRNVTKDFNSHRKEIEKALKDLK